MRSRIELDDILRAILGSENVYFDAPKDEVMSYPAIRYSLGAINNIYANDAVYMQRRTYNLVVIDEDPDSEIALKVSQLSNCKSGRHYTVDGLHHDTVTIEF